MNKGILPIQQSAAAEVQAEICIKIASPQYKVLIDFLINQKIGFRVNAYSAELEITGNTQMVLSTAVSDETSENTKLLLERVYLKYISRNNSQSPNIEELAKEIGWTPYLFKSRFKAYYGKSFYQAYLEQKMEYAAELLDEGWKAVEVSEKVGYSKPIKFNKMFQKFFGTTPKKYQMKQ